MCAAESTTLDGDPWEEASKESTRSLSRTLDVSFGPSISEPASDIFPGNSQWFFGMKRRRQEAASPQLVNSCVEESAPKRRTMSSVASGLYSSFNLVLKSLHEEKIARRRSSLHDSVTSTANNGT